MKATKISIPASDGYLLGAKVFEPENARGAIMVNSGTGIPKEFYGRLAQHLASQNYAVVIYDYRGIGDSRPATLRGFQAFMHEWGEKDMTGVLDWLAQRYPALPKFALAHSVGGQLIGLMPNHRELSAVLMVGTSTGYWRWFPAPFKYYCAFVWYGFVPFHTRFTGYVPSRKIGQGEDLPAGVAQEWAHWCKHKDYLAIDFGKSIKENFYNEIKTPIMALGFTDDNIANKRTMPAILDFYRNAPKEIEWIAPSDIGKQKIGHFGFFSSKNKEHFWHKPTEWFAQFN